MLTPERADLFRQQCFTDGQWTDADGGGVVAVTNPATERSRAHYSTRSPRSDLISDKADIARPVTLLLTEMTQSAGRVIPMDF